MRHDDHTTDGDVESTTPVGPFAAPVWRYSDMCRYWNVSRATVERWVRLYEQLGEGIPVHRDPSGRPYWLPEEAAAAKKDTPPAATPAFTNHITRSNDERLARLRSAAQRRYRIT